VAVLNTELLQLCWSSHNLGLCELTESFSAERSDMVAICQLLCWHTLHERLNSPAERSTLSSVAICMESATESYH